MGLLIIKLSRHTEDTLGVVSCHTFYYFLLQLFPLLVNVHFSFHFSCIQLFVVFIWFIYWFFCQFVCFFIIKFWFIEGLFHKMENIFCSACNYVKNILFGLKRDKLEAINWLIVLDIEFRISNFKYEQSGQVFLCFMYWFFFFLRFWYLLLELFWHCRIY